jgi:hypothetical protein
MIYSPNDLAKLIYEDKLKVMSSSMSTAGIKAEDIDDVTEEVRELLKFYLQNKKVVEKMDIEKEERHRGKRKAAKKS